MTPTASPDWEGIRIAWETTDLAVIEIGKTFGVFHLTIHARSKRDKWLPRPGAAGDAALALDVFEPVGRTEPSRRPAPRAPAKTRRKAAGPSSRRGVQDVIDRLWAAIVRRLGILERQLAAIGDNNPQDAERVDRSMRIIMQNLEKVRSLDAGNKRPRKSPKLATPVGAAADGTLDAERSALAQRIEQLHAQWLARRGAGVPEPTGDGAPEPPDGPRLADGGAPGTAAPAAD